MVKYRKGKKKKKKAITKLQEPFLTGSLHKSYVEDHTNTTTSQEVNVQFHSFMSAVIKKGVVTNSFDGILELLTISDI